MNHGSLGVDFNRQVPGDARLSPQERKLKAVCREFEAVMLAQMLSQVSASSKGGLLEGGSAMRTYRTMRDDALARDIAHGDGMGVADMLYRQLAARQR
jgi:flagellar protein FlgJ